MIVQAGGLRASVTVDEATGAMVGKVTGGPELITGATVADLKAELLRVRSARWRDYGGKFHVRMTPRLHRALAEEARRRGVRMNALAVEIFEKALGS